MNSKKREYEKAIFEAFRRVHPDFAGEPTHEEVKQPCDETEFPDVICTTVSGKRVGVELGQWFNEQELRTAKSMERIQNSILDAIGPQGNNETDNIYVVWPKPKIKARIKSEDTAAFRKEIFQCIADVDKRWGSEGFRYGLQGYEAQTEDLKGFPHLAKYLAGIRFFPRQWYFGWPPNGYVSKRTWSRGRNWIIFPARGGSYSEETMLHPLLELIAQKQEHYGNCGTGFNRLCLVVYYNLAVLYNSPIEALDFKFDDAVQIAKEFIGDDPKPFDDIFLFLAINDGQVFRIV
jgi:hypothetical protein